MSISGLLGGRYRIEDAFIGEGGMGIVYRAVDTAAWNRLVAVKTIKGPVDQASVEQFRKESRALANLCHPNIVDIYDVGEFVDKDGKKPYFVMPFLQGSDLSKLLDAPGSRLDPERLVGIICQACNALQTAHKRNIIHRDLKPSNLFVLEDDSVKVIDFGVVHLAGGDSGPIVKGTVPYMAPEQLAGNATAQSDIFSLAVVAYRALTGSLPFDGKTLPELMEAIRSHIPRPIPELNPGVPYPLAQVIHRALAKLPNYRWSSAREFSDLLQRALKNEPLPQFDRNRITVQISRIRKALSESDCQFASEMLTELEAEGHIDPEISAVRGQVKDATQSRRVRQLLESARLRLDREDYADALQNVQQALDLEKDNIDALNLKCEITEKQGLAGIQKSYESARQYLQKKLFSKAREEAQKILKRYPGERRAQELLSEILWSEQEQNRLEREVKQLYDSVLNAYGNGEMSVALHQVERVIELKKRLYGQTKTDCDNLRDEIRKILDELQALYEEGRGALDSKDFAKARRICQQLLERSPRNLRYQALKIAVDEQQGLARSAAITELQRRVDAEADPENKLRLAEDGLRQFPNEPVLVDLIRFARDKRDLVNSIVKEARRHESQGRFGEARNQWEVLKNIYPQYPDLELELERLSHSQERFLSEQAKAAWVERIESALVSGDYIGADKSLNQALAEFPENPELVRLRRQLGELTDAQRQAQNLLEKSQKLASAGNYLPAIQNLRSARELDRNSPSIHLTLSAVLASHARVLVEQDWPAALPFYNEARELNPNDPAVASVSQLIEGARRRDEMPSGPVWLENSTLDNRYNANDAIPDLRPENEANIEPSQKVGKDYEKSEHTAREDLRHITKVGVVPAALVFVIAAVLVFLGKLGSSGYVTSSPQRGTSAAERRTARPTLTEQHPQPKSTIGSGSAKSPAVPNLGATPLPDKITHPPQRLARIPVIFGSRPEAARVRVDNNNDLTCSTPCELDVPPGSHRVSFSANNYETVRQNIQLPGDENLFVALPQETQTIQVISVPNHVSLTVDGEDKGETPMSLRLTLGEHRLKVTDNGLTREQKINVVKQEDGFPIWTLNLTGSSEAAPAATPNSSQPPSSGAPK